jgi:hypothetical protein
VRGDPRTGVSRFEMTGEERELLRSEIDRRKRERLGERSPMDGWVTLPEASGIVGIKATKLRLKVNALGIETIRCANRKLIRVEAWRRPVGRRRS